MCAMGVPPRGAPFVSSGFTEYLPTISCFCLFLLGRPCFCWVRTSLFLVVSGCFCWTDIRPLPLAGLRDASYDNRRSGLGKKSSSGVAGVAEDAAQPTDLLPLGV